MITAEKCRLYAAQSKVLGAINIPTKSSIHQSVMSHKWSALADQIDRDDLRDRTNALIAEMQAKKAALHPK